MYRQILLSKKRTLLNEIKIFSLNIYALNIYMYINVEFQKGENYRKRFKNMQNIHLARLIESF